MLLALLVAPIHHLSCLLTIEGKLVIGQSTLFPSFAYIYTCMHTLLRDAFPGCNRLVELGKLWCIPFRAVAALQIVSE